MWAKTGTCPATKAPAESSFRYNHRIWHERLCCCLEVYGCNYDGRLEFFANGRESLVGVAHVKQDEGGANLENR